MNPIDRVRSGVRAVMRRVARGLNAATGGRLHPNAVTIVGLLAHIPIAWLIATTRNNVWAAVLLIIFGLFDTLDGELARLQKRASGLGMLLDSVTDRLKEIMVHSGIAWALIASHHTYAVVWVVLAVGFSLILSYIHAWGDVILLKQGVKQHKVNTTFRGGIMSFEVRITTLIVGLLLNELLVAVIIVAVLGFVTAIERFVRVARKLV